MLSDMVCVCATAAAVSFWGSFSVFYASVPSASTIFPTMLCFPNTRPGIKTLHQQRNQQRFIRTQRQHDLNAQL